MSEYEIANAEAYASHYCDARNQSNEKAIWSGVRSGFLEGVRHAEAPLRSQLEEAKHDRDEARKDLIVMHELFGAATEVNLHARSKFSSLAAQVATMREALQSIERETYPEDGSFYEKINAWANEALSTPATEWEKRVQGLVEALRELLKNIGHHHACRDDGSHSPCGCWQKEKQALAAWEGKS